MHVHRHVSLCATGKEHIPACDTSCLQGTDALQVAGLKLPQTPPNQARKLPIIQACVGFPLRSTWGCEAEDG